MALTFHDHFLRRSYVQLKSLSLTAETNDELALNILPSMAPSGDLATLGSTTGNVR